MVVYNVNGYETRIPVDLTENTILTLEEVGQAIIDSYDVIPGDRLPKLKWGKIKLNRNSFITFKGGFYEKY